MGRLRQWVQRHEDLFFLEKYHGRWELVLKANERVDAGVGGRHNEGKYAVVVVDFSYLIQTYMLHQ